MNTSVIRHTIGGVKTFTLYRNKSGCTVEAPFVDAAGDPDPAGEYYLVYNWTNESIKRMGLEAV